MSVSRIRETPRTTKPYTEEQWAALLAVGKAIEHEYNLADLLRRPGVDFDGVLAVAEAAE